ncbi:MAG: TPM domain-containing protein [Acidobacteria bacterium]|nr:TPM domain-containing protein [Acidobacteriota bacterium]
MNSETHIRKIRLRLLRFSILFVLIEMIAFSSHAGAQDLLKLPRPNSLVSDYAEVLDLQTRTKLDEQLKSFRERSEPAVDIAVVIVKTTGERPIFDYSLALARAWGIGSKDDVNPGALLFVAIDDRKYQTQISSDLEAELPDGLVGSIQRQFLVPQFKAGKYGKGIEDTIAAYIRTIELKRGINNEADIRPEITLPDFLLQKPGSLVTDHYGILETPTKTVMNRHLENFRDSSKPPVSVYLVIIGSTYGVSAEDYSYAIAKAWDLDLDKETNRDVLIFISMVDKSYFTRAGRGLTAELPRSSIERIEKNLLGYAFSPSSGEYNRAISKTVNAYVRSIDPKMPEIDFTLGNPDGFRGYDNVFAYLLDSSPAIIVGGIFLLVAIFVILSIIKDVSGGGGSGSYGSYDYGSSDSSSSSSWSSSDSSGGSGGFGGGGDFGGGGAGGSW